MVDYLVAVCRSCGHTVHVSVEHQGRRAKCPRCDAVIEIPRSDTSVRLRSDRELTSEARAKAGKTGPETDHDQKHGTTIRHITGHVRRVASKPSAPKRLALILTLVATAAIVAGILVVLLKGSGGSKEAEGSKAGVKTGRPAPPPPPPPPAVDPRADDREAIKGRVREYVSVLNSNNLNRVAAFYSADIDAVRKAFGEVLPSMDSEIAYENMEIKSIDFQDPNVHVKIAVRRVIRNKETGTSDAQDGVERLLVWTIVKDEIRNEEKYKIVSPPQF